jgi:hypothetical protein
VGNALSLARGASLSVPLQPFAAMTNLAGYQVKKTAPPLTNGGLQGEKDRRPARSRNKRFRVVMVPSTHGRRRNGAQVACGGRPVGAAGASGSAISPGCLFELLRMAPPDPAAAVAAGGSPALTVEGWANLGTNDGGVLLSVGAAGGLPGAPSPSSPCATPSAAPTMCQLAML